MKSITLIFVYLNFLRIRRVAIVCAVAALLMGTWNTAMAQTAPPAYYSTGSGVFLVQQPSPQVAGSGNVAAGANAVDGDFSTFATLTTDATATVGKSVALRLNLTGESPAGYRAGMVVANATGLLGLNAIGTVRLRTYLTGATPELREEKVVRPDLVRAALLALARPTQLEFTSSKSFDAVEIVVDGLIGVYYATNIYYAYGVQPGIQTRATGYLSQFVTPVAGSEYGTASSAGALCLNTNVDNPSRVADADLTNFASFSSLITGLCQPALRTKLAGVSTGGAPAGYYAGFVVGQDGLLDVGVLSGLRVSTYRNGTPMESQSGTGILELTLLPGNKAQVSFPTTKAFDEVQIERTGLLTAVDNLQLYYGFGLAPAAFQGINPVRSDFAAPVAPTNYSASEPEVIVVTSTVSTPGPVGLPPVIISTSANVTLSSIDNPRNAADADVTNYAQLNIMGAAVPNTATASLSVRLNGLGRAGNRVGMVVGTGAAPLDLSVLARLTLSTYDARNVLIESKAGSALLAESLLGGTNDRSKVSFLASRDFSYVQLTVSSVASLLSNTRAYYAFAEDVPLLSLQYPLPVELTAFNGRWASGAAVLTWATASEKNSSHFVVERSIGGKSVFWAVGQVAARGNSSRPWAYQLRDETAGAQKVALLYYRLRQVDTDGKESFSPVIAVVAGQRAVVAPQLALYPNPAAGAQAVWVHCANVPAGGGATVQTYSELGQLVSQLPVGAGPAQLPLPVLVPGLYYVVLRDAAGQKLATQRLLVGAGQR